MRRFLRLFGLVPVSVLIAESARADELERALADRNAALKRLCAEKPTASWTAIGGQP